MSRALLPLQRQNSSVVGYGDAIGQGYSTYQSPFEPSELCELKVHLSLCETLRPAGLLQVTRAHHKQLVLFDCEVGH